MIKLKRKTFQKGSDVVFILGKQAQWTIFDRDVPLFCSKIDYNWGLTWR